jgi:hypothetical protein
MSKSPSSVKVRTSPAGAGGKDWIEKPGSARVAGFTIEAR